MSLAALVTYIIFTMHLTVLYSMNDCAGQHVTIIAVSQSDHDGNCAERLHYTEHFKSHTNSSKYFHTN